MPAELPRIRIDRDGSMWRVTVEGRPDTRWATEWDALRFARYAAERAGGGEIVVRGETGIERTERIDGTGTGGVG